MSETDTLTDYLRSTVPDPTYKFFVVPIPEPDDVQPGLGSMTTPVYVADDAVWLPDLIQEAIDAGSLTARGEYMIITTENGLVVEVYGPLLVGDNIDRLYIELTRLLGPELTEHLVRP